MNKLSTLASIVFVLLLAPSSQAQRLPELLSPVNENKAQQLIEYNSPWLQAELYSAKRFRIVRVDTSILMKDDDFTVTLFDDLTPLHLTKDSIQRWEDAFAWNALILVDIPDVLRAAGARQTALLSGVAWDTDKSGRPLPSFDNRFQFSPNWTFDFFDRPVLEVPEGQGHAVVTGPPPQTAAEIARHKELKELNKHAFYSVSADFQMLLPRVTYRLEPLKYAPKYHLLFELDPAKVVPIEIDRSPGEVAVTRDPGDQVKLSTYENFLRSLPPENNVPVVEELQ